MNRHQQQGLVLIASLFLLLVITALAAGIFSNINLQMKMAGNYSDHASSFEVANAAIQNQWPGLPITAAGETITEVRTRTLHDTYDLTGSGADYDVSVEICYLGSTQALGSDLSFDAHLFRMRTTVSNAAGMRSVLEQSGYFLAEDSPFVLPASC